MGLLQILWQKTIAWVSGAGCLGRLMISGSGWYLRQKFFFALNTNPDTVFWNLNKKKRFTTKSVYEWLERDLAGPNYKWIWKASIPLKIKIFLWQLFQMLCLLGIICGRGIGPGIMFALFARTWKLQTIYSLHVLLLEQSGGP